MKLKKSLLALGCMGILAGGSAAHAGVINFTMDFGALTDPDHGGVTGPLERIQFALNTQTYQYVADPNNPLQPGDVFVDRGYGNATAYVTDSDAPAGQESPSFFPQTYAMGLIWNELTGVIESAETTSAGTYVVQTEYTGVDCCFELWVTDFGNPSPGFGQNYEDAVDFYKEGERVMRMGLVSGDSILEFSEQGGNFIEGTFTFEFEVTDVLPGFWFTEDGVDFADLTEAPNFQVSAFASAGTIQTPAPVTTLNDPVGSLASPFGETFGNDNQALFSETLSRHDGSLRFAVPEPGTLALMGMALLMLGFFSHNRRRENGAGSYAKAA